MTCGFGALGGVFGQVAGDGQVGNGTGARDGDDADVDLIAPADGPAAGQPVEDPGAPVRPH